MEDPHSNSMLAKLQPSLQVRRKSSPAITGLDTFALHRIAESATVSSLTQVLTKTWPFYTPFPYRLIFC